MNALRLPTFRRVAALAALLAFAALPHGHLRGHEEIADALATVAVAAPAVSAAAAPDAPGHACPLCLSLASLRSGWVQTAEIAVPFAPFTARIPTGPAPIRAAAPGTAPSEPRAPPLA